MPAQALDGEPFPSKCQATALCFAFTIADWEFAEIRLSRSAARRISNDHFIPGSSFCFRSFGRPDIRSFASWAIFENRHSILRYF